MARMEVVCFEDHWMGRRWSGGGAKFETSTSRQGKVSTSTSIFVSYISGVRTLAACRAHHPHLMLLWCDLWFLMSRQKIRVKSAGR